MAIAPKTGVQASSSVADTSQEEAALLLQQHLLRQRALRVAKQASEIAREARRIAKDAGDFGH